MTPDGKSRAVVAYDPAGDTARTLDAELPRGLAEPAAAYVDGVVYLFGGARSWEHRTDHVHRFDPAEGTLERVDADLPTGVQALAAATDPRPTEECPHGCVYLIGGEADRGRDVDTVHRFDPSEPDVETVPVDLREPLLHASAVFTGERVLVYGGTSGGDARADVVALDPATGELLVMPERLPEPRTKAGAAWTGNGTALVGGQGPDGVTDAVLAHHPAPHGPAGPEAPPAHVKAERTGEIGTVAVDWEAPDAGVDGGVDDYEVRAGASPHGNASQARIDSTEAELSGLPCGQEAYASVRASDADGPGPWSGAAHAPESAPDTELLCHLDRSFPFRWGPVATPPETRPNDPPPRSMDALEENDSRTPTWFGAGPYHLSCCQPVTWDADRAEDEPPDRQIHALEAFDEILDGYESTPDLRDPLIEPFTFNVTGNGLTLTGPPQDGLEDPWGGDLPGPVGVHGERTTTASVSGPDTDASREEDTYSPVHLHRGPHKVHLHNDFWRPNQHAFTGFAGHTIQSQEPWTRPVTLDVAGYPVPVNATLGAAFHGSPQVLGATTQGDWSPGERLDRRAALVQASVNAPGTVQGSVDGPEGLEADLAADARLSGGLDVGVVDGEEPVDSLASNVSWATLDGVPTPTVLLHQAGSSGWRAPLDADATLYDVLTVDDTVDPGSPLGVEDAVLVFAPATIRAPTADAIVRLEDGTEHRTTDDALEVPADDRDLVFEIEGEPGSLHNVTVQRPIPKLWNGPVVEMRNMTIPDVRVGDDGSTLLHLDTAGLQKTSNALTDAYPNLFDGHAAVFPEILDANGDGAPDLDQDVVGPNDRDPVRLDVTVTGPTGPRKGYTDEPVTVRAEVTRSDTGQPPEPAPTRGSIEVTWSGETLGTAPVGSDGVATLEAPVPDVLPGDRYASRASDLQVSYSGTDRVRAATQASALSVAERPAPIHVASPQPFEVVDVDDNAWYAFEATPVPATHDLRTGNATLRVDGGSPMDVAFDDGTFERILNLGSSGLDLEEGPHTLELRVPDDTENATARTTFVVESDPPSVDVTTPDRVLRPAEPLTVEWSADEPVAANLTVRPAGEVTPRHYESDGFRTSGTFTVEDLPPGAHAYSFTVVDAAGQHPVDPRPERPRVAVVIP